MVFRSPIFRKLLSSAFVLIALYARRARFLPYPLYRPAPDSGNGAAAHEAVARIMTAEPETFRPRAWKRGPVGGGPLPVPRDAR